MQNYKLVFFVPENAIEEVKQAIFATGAGSLGNYAQCSWQTLGVGQFLPLEVQTRPLAKLTPLSVSANGA